MDNYELKLAKTCHTEVSKVMWPLDGHAVWKWLTNIFYSWYNFLATQSGAAMLMKQFVGFCHKSQFNSFSCI